VNDTLSNKHIVVVGASSGIGKETAMMCAQKGASVSICARRKDKLREVVDEMDGKGHGCYELDVTWERKQIEQVFDQIRADRGEIDGLVYSAGISANMAFSMITKERLEKVLETNLLGAMTTTQAAVDFKRVNKGGCSIVWITSVAASKPSGGGLFMYSASKAAMLGGIKSISIELVKRNIRINAVSPGAVKTEIWEQYVLSDKQMQALFEKHPLGIGEPKDIAAACTYLLSSEARWITGQEFIIDGGFTLA